MPILESDSGHSAGPGATKFVSPGILTFNSGIIIFGSGKPGGTLEDACCSAEKVGVESWVTPNVGGEPEEVVEEDPSTGVVRIGAPVGEVKVDPWVVVADEPELI